MINNEAVYPVELVRVNIKGHGEAECLAVGQPYIDQYGVARYSVQAYRDVNTGIEHSIYNIDLCKKGDRDKPDVPKEEPCQ